MKRLLLHLALAGLLAGCAPPPATADDARQALIAFFDHLDQGEYTAADALYGGSYETLAAMNPDLDPDDHAALWEHGCLQNGLQCLTIRSAAAVEWRDGGFLFKVEFNAPGGSLFVLGPCCGATETEMPSKSLFDYKVIEVEGRYKVIDLPVYIP